MAFPALRGKGDLWTGLAIGVGILAAPVVIPVVAAALRPLIKAGVKGVYVAYEKGRESCAHAKEMAEDLVEEVKSEVHASASDEEQAGT